MTLTNSLFEVANALVTNLEANKTTLGLYAVHYGDQSLLEGTPLACVEPDVKRRTLKNAQRGTELTMYCQIFVYISAVQSPELNRQASDQVAEDIEDFIHADRTLGGLLIHCMITELASGYATKAGTLIKTSRLQFEGISQYRLPS